MGEEGGGLFDCGGVVVERSVGVGNLGREEGGGGGGEEGGEGCCEELTSASSDVVVFWGCCVKSARST